MTGNLSGLNPMIYNRNCRRVSGYLWQLYGNTNNNTDTSHRVGDWALSVLKVGQTAFNDKNKQAQTEGWRECGEAMQTKPKFTTTKYQLSQHCYYEKYWHRWGLADLCLLFCCASMAKFQAIFSWQLTQNHLFCKETRMLTLYPNIIWHSLRKINLINTYVPLMASLQ